MMAGRVSTRCLAALFCLGAMLGLSACHDEPGAAALLPAARVDGDVVTLDAKAPQMQALQIQAVDPSQAPVHTFTGRIAWNEEVTVRVYSPVAGRVVSILREPGQSVTPAETLARIKSADFGQVQADARKAATSLALAARTRDRQRDLYAHGAAAKQEQEAAEADYQRALSENERSQSVLALYGGRAGPVDNIFDLTSPIGGTVVDRTLTPGQQIRPDQMLASDPGQLQPLFVVTNPNTLWVVLDVAEADLAALKPGQQLTLRTRAYPDRVFNGRLTLVGASLDPATRTVKARGVVENVEGLLKAEMYVRVDATDTNARPSGVDIPMAAHFLDGDRHYVFVETQPGRFRRTLVQLGPESDHHIAVVDGLEPGDRVVTRGGLLLQQMLEAGAAG